MSYILDALKKSEKERQRGPVPDLLTVQDAVMDKPKGRMLWPYLILTALVLNAALVFWKYPFESKKVVTEQANAVPPQPLPAETSSAVTTIAKTSSEDKASKTKEAPVSKVSVEKKQKADNVFSLQEKTDKAPQADIPKVTAPKPAVQEKKQVSRPADTKSPTESHAPKQVPENRIYNRSELPASVQQALPDFNITVSIYSDNPAARMIKLNGQTLREGEYLSAGLKLEEILQNGAIMSYQNYRFRIGLR